ncbi:MAG: GGDEF domain-containing protein [Pseudomonadales bacterium]|nr:GGDEF domain-containing protein [Pseudomonadales bacterium]
MPISFPHDINKAADYLRKAVPMMVQYKIPPTPENYALWYNYVAAGNQELNQELMATVEDHGTCPRSDSQKLIRQFVLEDALTTNPEMYSHVNSVVNQFEGVMQDTQSGTQEYSQSLEASIKAFTEVTVEPDDLQHVAETMADNAEAIFALTQSFQAHMRSSQKEIDSLKTELEKQYQRVMTDPMTKIFNRLAFNEKIDELVASQSASFCLILFDLDHFKKFNDTFGHTLGDSILQGVAQTTQRTISPIKNAHFSRYGGEEFALLLPDCKVQHATTAAETIRGKLEKLGIRNKSGTETIDNITASFGVAQHKAGELTSDLVDRADDALYLAKANGRNQVHTA